MDPSFGARAGQRGTARFGFEERSRGFGRFGRAASGTSARKEQAVKEAERLDRHDLEILDIVQSDATKTQSEIAERIGLSVQAVSERLRKLEGRSVIRRYVALLDAKRLGKDITSFISVLLEHPNY